MDRRNLRTKSADQLEDERNPLIPPDRGSIPIAFPISQGAVIIDFCGPWEVFHSADIPGHRGEVFQTYTVAESLEPITASGGMKIVPNYTFETAPAPKVVVIPAQADPTQAMLNWIRSATKTTDVTMSVCTGAFLLADTGLLSGKSATTFHEAYERFEAQYPDIHLKRGARFVEDGNLASAGGLSSGIDLAIRVIERYFGREAAERTAYTLEYQGMGWQGPDSNAIYAD
jgi:transcriptional regulator GlxA family with amidase domain